MCCALQLSRAAHWYYDQPELFIEWEDDPLPWDGDDSVTPDRVECVSLVVHETVQDGDVKHLRKRTVQSLCGIGDADYTYKRVVEAELILEYAKEINADFV